MAINNNDKLILANLEAAYGVAPGFTAANAIQVSGVELTPLAGEEVEREIEYPYYGNSGGFPVNSHHAVTFKVEIAGAGLGVNNLPGKVPAYGPLLRACGFAQVVTADTNVKYSPVTGGEESIAVGVNIDGQNQILLGSRGDLGIEVARNAIPYFTFTFTGLYQDPASVVQLVNPDFGGFFLPRVASNANTPTFVFHGINDLGLTSFTYGHGNEIGHRELINAATSVNLTGRSPSINMVVDAQAYSAFNPVVRSKAATEGALKLIHGTDAGNIVEFDAPKVRIGIPTQGDDNGVMQWTIPAAPQPDSGNDEFVITVR